MKYYQSLTEVEKQYIQDNLCSIDYFFKEDLSSKDFKTLDFISKQKEDNHEFLISLNNNKGFVSAVYNSLEKFLYGITIINFDYRNKYKFFRKVLKALKFIEIKLDINEVHFSVFKHLDYVVSLDTKLCNRLGLELMEKSENEDFYNFRYRRRAA